jgi:phage N-6-adenine-methyltransferase
VCNVKVHTALCGQHPEDVSLPDEAPDDEAVQSQEGGRLAGDVYHAPIGGLQLMPPLGPEDYQALKRDIAEVGVLVPVEYDEDGNVLDGHHRIRACRELGIEVWPRLIREGLDDPGKRTHARRLNIARRHLDAAQKRLLVADELKVDPVRSNRQIAASLGLHHETVGAVRNDLERRGEIRHVATVIDTSGRVQPAHKPARTVFIADEGDSPAEQPRHNVNRTSFTGNTEWHTPEEYLDLARQVLGGFDLDPASNPIAQGVVRANTFYGRDDDGLSQDWTGRVWLNPPYAQPAIRQFVDKMVAEYGCGRVSEAIMLTHNYTDTGWFQTAARAASAICLTKGRIRFVSGEGGPAGTPTQGQAFFYFGQKPEGFADVFAPVGLIVTEWKQDVAEESHSGEGR